MDKAQPLEQPKQIDNYRVIREVGRGGMGVVYEAEHREFKNRVAIKVLHPRLAQDPQILARFRLEAIAANVPQHPGIAQVLGGSVMAETDGGSAPYFAFPVKMSDYAFSLDRPPPAAGEHNAAVLRELGHGEDAIAALKAAGAI